MFKVGDKVKLKIPLYGYDAGTEFTVKPDYEDLQGIAVISVGYVNMYHHLFLKVEKPKNQFSIKKGQIEAAARFIVANNNYLTDSNPKQVGLRISSIIQRMIDNINAGKEDWYCSTGGYTVIINHEDTNYYSVEVNVDPSVSSDEEYVYVEEIL